MQKNHNPPPLAHKICRPSPRIYHPQCHINNERSLCIITPYTRDGPLLRTYRFYNPLNKTFPGPHPSTLQSFHKPGTKRPPRKLIQDNYCEYTFLFESILLYEPLTPWVFTFKWKDEPPVLSFWSFFCLFSNGHITHCVKYCCNIFCWLFSGFFCKTASRQKKMSIKNLY